MKAVVYEEFRGPVSVETLPDPEPQKQSVVVKVEATGLCLSDWHGWMGHDKDIRLPHVPGHELAGTVVETGKEVKKFAVGNRVTVPFVCACGNCEQCQTGNHQVCDHQSQPGFTHWGSFAQYVTIDYADTNLVRLPESVDMHTAASLGCRFVTAFRAIVDQANVQPAQFVAIHGCGGVGLSAIMIANALGAQVIAIDINENALSLASQLGAQMTVNATSGNVIEEIKELTKGGTHVSLDALGSAQTSFNSISSLRKRGKHIQVGLLTGNESHPKVPMDQVVAHELEIIGSHGIQAFRYPAVFDLIEKGGLEPSKMIRELITLEEAAAEMPRMDQFRSAGILMVDLTK